MDFPVSLAIDDKPETGWAIFPEMGKPHEATFDARRAYQTRATPRTVVVTLDFQSVFAGHHPGRFRLSASRPSRTPRARRVFRRTSATPWPSKSARRTDVQKAAIRDHYRRTASPEFRPLIAELETQKKRRADLEKAIPTAMVMSEMATPRDTFILMRGQYDKKGEKVTAGVPAFLPPLPDDAPRNRLGLARWLVDPKHPLTSRVAVNRLWQGVFGTGLVKTSEDFGTQGEAPSHPELLDWLAVEFSSPKEGPAWSVKRMIRLMVTSSAYRQSSQVTPDRLAKDPEDRFLSRAPRLRLSAESLRDQALFAERPAQGEGRRPERLPLQPARPVGGADVPLRRQELVGADLHAEPRRRPLPPHDVHVLEAHLPAPVAGHLRRPRPRDLHRPPCADQHAPAGPRDAERPDLRRGLAQAGRAHPEGRRPDPTTTASPSPSAWRPRGNLGPKRLEIVRQILLAERAKFRAEPEKAVKLLSVGEAKRDESLDPSEVAAWSTVAGVILNLDEVVTRG